MFTTDDASALELDPRPARVLVFGSHLAFGSVGLNAGLPVYAEADIRCAAVPTIVLSNLPHYRSVQRIDVSAQWITDALRDLTAAGALETLEAIAVGYLAHPDQALAIADWYRRWDPIARPPLILDPTFGDADVGFYTDPSVAPALSHSLTDEAAIITPNLFELAHLTRGDDAVAPLDPADITVAASRARRLARGRDAAVVVTGLRTESGQIANLIVDGDRQEIVVGPELSTAAKGLGDVFTAGAVSALINGANLATAVGSAAARVRRAIGESTREGGESTGEGGESTRDSADEN